MTLILRVGMILTRSSGRGRPRAAQAPPRGALLLLEADVAERHPLRMRLNADVARGVVGGRRNLANLVLARGLREGRDLLVDGLLAVLRLPEPHRVLVADDFDLVLVPLAGLKDGAGLEVLLLRLAVLARRDVVDGSRAVLLEVGGLALLVDLHLEAGDGRDPRGVTLRVRLLLIHVVPLRVRVAEAQEDAGVPYGLAELVRRDRGQTELEAQDVVVESLGGVEEDRVVAAWLRDQQAVAQLEAARPRQLPSLEGLLRAVEERREVRFNGERRRARGDLVGGAARERHAREHRVRRAHRRQQRRPHGVEVLRLPDAPRLVGHGGRLVVAHPESA